MTITLLTLKQLAELDQRIAARADALIAARTGRIQIQPKPSKEITTSNRGRPPKSIANPFYLFIGATTNYGRYPLFAMDIIVGIARLDWHDRRIGTGGKSMPLSVRNLVVILEMLEKVTSESVCQTLRLAERHAQRYVKAIELIIPHMMRARPKSLILDMEEIHEPGNHDHDWEDIDELIQPDPDELAKLHHDLRTLGVD
ncbi:hypothetical protein NVV94_17555 [Pseudomonas sp. LS1212]|uniref:hypothetical protein n=1 Tax=Pseudomonas sp. LS1212 TaxID=2972478 RepID=UPI00215D494B|nr:hypothetical protein [Pseudomonas sp. LS1212]UVJ42430.1 hypothetical protein NVV94_17555 [Pseudomonas sp. LS1212]